MIKVDFSVAVTDNTPLDLLIREKFAAKNVRNTTILKKSVDARKKNDVRYNMRVAFDCDNENFILRRGAQKYEKDERTLEKLCEGKRYRGRPVIVGAGPSGLFTALVFGYVGAKPLIIEQGEKVEDRQKTVDKFFKTLTLDTSSNVQFGEGGAGTFSDGKLNTNVHNEYVDLVIKEFVKYGAPQEIAYLAKPHIGTDNLIEVVKNIREKIISLGGEFRFGEKLTDFRTRSRTVSEAVTDKGTYECDGLFLCIGHSSRDTFEMLYDKGVVMVPKTFSMGVRIEHLRSDINFSQYGDFAKGMPAADYKLAAPTSTGRSLYTFCMCPGGRVVNSSSENGEVCVNGMSYFARNDVNSNSAILVNVDEKDFGSNPLDGMYFQRKYEKLCYEQSNSFRPVVQLYGDLKNDRVSSKIGDIAPSVESGFCFGSLKECLPNIVTETILSGMEIFGRKIRGFDRPDAVLTGIEARSSSPIRITRDERYVSSTNGLYPLGEGAGYAGGITSSAIDGMRCALSLIE